MYVVLGATGRTGGAAAAALRERGKQVRAVVRDAGEVDSMRERGYDPVIADVHDRAALARAFRGAEGVYLFIPPNTGVADFLGDVEETAETLAAAVAEAAPRHVVALSSTGAQHPAGTGMYVMSNRIERALRGTSVPRTFLRPAEYTDNWGAYAHLAREHGVLPSFHQPLDHPFPQVSTRDVGQEAARLLLDPAEGERIVHLEGPARYTPEDVARTYTELMGRPVQPMTPPRESWVPTLVQTGMSESYASALAALYDASNEGGAGFEPGVGEMRRGTETLRTVLTRHLP
jgi:uncharacterized protein YbjT (DUF2867 family)